MIDNHVMFPLRACGHCFPLRSLRPPPSIVSPIRIHLPTGNSTATRRNPIFTSHTSRHVSSTSPPPAASSRSPNHPIHTYPTNLNVFNSGPVPTVSMGLFRIGCIAVFLYGTFYVAPAAYADPDAPWWMFPSLLVLPIVPFLATGLAFGGYVHHINVLLPTFARRSKNDLMRFAARVPQDTRVEIKCMRFRPWPVTTTAYFGDLRRLRESQVRLANLEHVPLGAREAMEESGWKGWLVKMVMGRYWVSRAQVKDRSRVPGVWDRMWEQIPVVGEEGKSVERVAYSIRNRGMAGGRTDSPSGMSQTVPPPPLSRSPKR